MYPYIENDPGMLWTDTRFRKNVAKKGSSVIARAGMIGSENSLEMRVKLKYVPKLKITAM